MSIYRSMKLADAVLSVIEWSMNDDQRYFLEPYQNGREHGWTLSKGNKKVAFSEFRRSDDIVLYPGTSMSLDFDMAGNIPNEEVYNRKVFFAYNEVVKAAEHIIEYLENGDEDK